MRFGNKPSIQNKLGHYSEYWRYRFFLFWDPILPRITHIRGMGPTSSWRNQQVLFISMVASFLPFINKTAYLCGARMSKCWFSHSSLLWWSKGDLIRFMELPTKWLSSQFNDCKYHPGIGGNIRKAGNLFYASEQQMVDWRSEMTKESLEQGRLALYNLMTFMGFGSETGLRGNVLDLTI